MGRPLTKLVVFFVAMNLFAGVLQGSGVAAMLGLNTQVGQECPSTSPTDEQIQNNPNCELISESQEVQTGTGQGSTLFGMYNTLARGVSGIYDYVYPGLEMMERLGVPSEFTDMLAHLFTVMIGVAILAYARGWDL